MAATICPAGALANVVEGRLVMEAVVVSPDGLEIVRDEIDGPAAQAETLGVKLAVRMLERGAREIVEAVADDRADMSRRGRARAGRAVVAPGGCSSRSAAGRARGGRTSRRHRRRGGRAPRC